MKIISGQPVAEGVHEGHWWYQNRFPNSPMFVWRNFGTFRKHYAK